MLTETEPHLMTVEDLEAMPIDAAGDNRIVELWFAGRRTAMNAEGMEARRLYRIAEGRDRQAERAAIQRDYPPVACFLRRSPFMPMDLSQPPRLMANYLRTNHELTPERFEQLPEDAQEAMARKFADSLTMRRILPESDGEPARLGAEWYVARFVCAPVILWWVWRLIVEAF